MNSIARINKIQTILNSSQEPIGRRTIRFRGKSEERDVYEIPLEYLIYNVSNGRILSRVLSQATQNKRIDVETPEGKKQIETLLWDSKKDKNKKTQKDIEEYGQQEPGIITLDGVIVDGNRRAMLLNSLGRTHFRAVILDIRIEDDPKEIERLETIYQMGADEKQDYNPIEKYLKVNEMMRKDFKKEEIAEYMNESVKDIELKLQAYETMSEYLEYIGCEGIYTQLDGREDQILRLTDSKKRFKDGNSHAAFEGYSDNDVDDLMMISFDYIRDQFEGKEFRLISNGKSADNFLFGNKKIWENFRDKHFENIEPINEKFREFNHDSDNLIDELQARDAEWKAEADGPLKFNLNKSSDKLQDLQEDNKPKDLLEKALNALNSVNTDNEHFNEELLGIIKEINNLTYEFKKQLGA